MENIPARQAGLIFDVGVHTGEDTAFYLKKGFNVVGVEANPDLCRDLRRTFAKEISDGRFRLVQAAVAEKAGSGIFYRFEKSVFGTISPDWAARNTNMGVDFDEIEVHFVTPIELYQTYGVPYFIKIDIEGADMLCIEALASTAKPEYISVEAEKHDFSKFEREVRFIASLGYSEFQLVQQQTVPFQKIPVPPREGIEVKHRFSFGASGLFGKDLPEQQWISLDAVLRKYRRIVRKHHVFGDFGLGRKWLPRQMLRASGLYPGWHDLHARIPD